MNNTITEENLILFIYDEAAQKLKGKIQLALLNDPAVREKYDLLLSSVHQLDEVFLKPDDTSVSIILEESALTHREEIY